MKQNRHQPNYDIAATSSAVSRTRKVRYHRRSPCSICRRANITCVYPISNRPPRWARHFEASSGITGAALGAASNTSAVDDEEEDSDRVMVRLQNSENLVRELRDHLRETS